VRNLRYCREKISVIFWHIGFGRYAEFYGRKFFIHSQKFIPLKFGLSISHVKLRNFYELFIFFVCHIMGFLAEWRNS
jgi:hypothetical protein